jgi:hypothetical protein
MRAAMVDISKVSGSVVSLADGEDGGFGGDEDGGDVLSFASALSWVEPSSSGAVTASFDWPRLAAREARTVADGCSEI